jgi:hypothetical protein
VSKRGAEVLANKLTGEKGVRFTFAYVSKFNEMEAAEREAEIKSHARPRLSEFNYAVKNVLNGMSQCYVNPENIMSFLRGVYEPLGIKVIRADDCCEYYSATEIASILGVYSETGKYHGHAVSAIISNLDDTASHTVAVPYGTVGVSVRYDDYILEAVWQWLLNNNFPYEVPYHGFEYHIYYANILSYNIDSELDIND